MPTITCAANATGVADPGVCTGTIAVLAPATGDNCGVASVVNDYNNTADANDDYPVGVTTVNWTVTDIYGNSATCPQTVTVSDTQAPSITCAADVVGTPNDAGVCSANITLTTPTVSDNCPWGAPPVVVSDHASVTFPVGNTTVTWTVTDDHANTAFCTQNVNVLDTEKPTVTCNTDITQTNDSGNCSAIVTVLQPTTQDDNCAVTSVTNSIDGDDNATGTYVVGTTNVIWTLSDAAGNQIQCTQQVTVTDNEVPDITCAADETDVTDPGVCTTVVAVTSPAASDNCTLVSTLNDFNGTNNATDTYPAGTTVLTWMATDNHGNTSTCTQNVIVTDNQDPVITCPADEAANNNLGVCEGTVNIMATPATATDNCGAPAITNNHASTTYPVGTTTVTWLATDVWGNTAICTQDVVITDTEAPVAACPGNQSVTTDPGVCEAVVNYPLPTFTDNCSVASTTGTHNPGDTFTVLASPTTVTYTVTDTAGLTGECSFTVTVTDGENPVITCPSDITVNNNPGVCEGTANVNTIPATATDNCNVASIANNQVSTTYPVGTTVITWTATDDAGNIHTCDQNVIVIDNEVPTITCPTDVTANADAACEASPALGSPITTDNCPGETTANNAMPPFQLGTTVVTWVVTDAHSNTASCDQNVTVVDVTPPTISCAVNETHDTDAGVCTAVVSPAAPAVTDNCDAAPGVTNNAPTPFPKGTTTVTWVVTDASGNSTSCNQDITIEDNEAPVITCPANISVNTAVGSCDATVDITTSPATATDNCDAAPVVSNDHASTTYLLGMTSVTWTALDVDGNVSTCMQTVTVSDNEDPVFTTCPTDVTVPSCNHTTAYYTYATPTATDNCSVGVAFTSGLGAGNGGTYTLSTPNVTETFTEVWTATDGSGNAVTCTFDVTVDPTIADIDFDNIPASVVLDNLVDNCHQNYTWPAVTAHSNSGCGPVTVSATDQDGRVVNGTAAFAYRVGINTITFVAEDAFGNTVSDATFTITVNDVQAPELSPMPADIVQGTSLRNLGECQATVNWVEPTVTDNCPGTSLLLEASFEGGAWYLVNTGDNFPKGVTTIRYTGTDASMNTVAATFTITVIDDEVPTVTSCPADITVNNEPTKCDAVVTYNEPTFTDNCAIGSTVNTSGHNSGDTFIVGVTPVVYTATDTSGNTNECTFNVTVIDTEVPVITCATDQTQTADAGVCAAAVTVVAPTIVENCAYVVVNDFNNTADASDTYPVAATTVTWTVTDASNHTASCTQVITVTDDELPVISCPADVSVSNDLGQCSSNQVYAVIATDNCSVTVMQTAGMASGSDFPVGTTTNSFTATDASGNTAACSFDIEVLDTELPVISCPTDINVANDAGLCSANVVYLVGNTDNCSATLTQTGGMASGSDFPVGTTTNSFTLTDAAGNSVSCSFDVTINDTEAPAITCPNDITVSNEAGLCEATVAWTEPVGTDNCSGSSTILVGGLGPNIPYAVGGPYTQTYRVTDGAGNFTECSFDVTVEDTELPVFTTCPTSVTIPSCNGVDAIYTYDMPIGTDNCTNPITAALVAGIGGGTYTLATPNTLEVFTETWTLTDGAGNVATCTFDITVDPGLSGITFDNVPASVTLTNIPDNCHQNYTWPNVTATSAGGCGPVTVTAVDQNGRSINGVGAYDYYVGVNTITFTAIDAFGNSITDNTFVITVLDIQNPEIHSMPANIAQGTSVNNPGACEATVNWTDPTATDNCPGVALIAEKSVDGGTTWTLSGPGDQFAQGVTIVRYTATDAVGLTVSEQFTVTVTDDEAPVAVCPANMVVDTDSGSCDAVVTYTVDLTDNCHVTSTTLTGGLASGAAFPLGVTTVSWEVVDDGGLTDNCSFSVTVNDTEVPTITCASDVSVNNDTGNCSAVVTLTAPTASDNCSTTVTNDHASTTFAVGTTTVTWTVIDGAGNQAQCTQDVTVTDTEAPTVTCAADQTENADAGVCETMVFVNTPTASADNCAVASVTHNSPIGTSTINASGTYPVGVYPITWTVTDTHGNTASCEQVVTVLDTQAPVITCAADVTVNNDLGVCGANVTLTDATATDNCDVATVVSDHVNPFTYPVGTTVVTWTAIDIHGNTSNCTQDVTVLDVEAPVVTCAADETHNNDTGICGAMLTAVAPTVTDNCTATAVNLHDESVAYPVGTTTITWLATDASGNTASCEQDITVVDVEAPVITCATAVTVSNDTGECEADVVLTTATATDNCAVATVVSDHASVTYPVGTTTVTWLATDIYGNTSNCTQDVTVNDTEVPVITCATDVTVSNDAGVCEAEVLLTDATATDNCGVATVVSDHANPFTYPVGTTTVTWLATDIHGNTANCTQDVTVNDTEAPVITCPAPVTVNNDAGVCGADVTLLLATANDNCDAAPAITNDHASVSFPVGTTDVTWTATDIYGNNSSCVQQVTVVDNELPTITCAAAQTQTADAGVCEANVAVVAPTAVNDNCTPTVVVNDQTGTADASGIYPVGTTTVTWTVTDPSGNQAQCTQDITVTDDEAPALTCETVTSTNDAGECGAMITTSIVATDNCAVATQVNDRDETQLYPVGTTTINWLVTDIHGNTSACTQDVVVTDDEDPTITVTPSVISVFTDPGVCNADVTVDAPVVTENCAVASLVNDYNNTDNATDNYPKGTTEIHWLVTDIYGHTAETVQFVVVTDNEAPVVTCGTDVVQDTDAGVCTAVVTVDSPAVSDNCAIFSVTNDYNGTDNASDTYPLGTTTVQWIVLDESGNITMCTQDITVEDHELPTITCAADMEQNNDTGVCGANVIVSTPVIADNCSATVVNDYNGTAIGTDDYPVGTTVVTWTVTDGSGNQVTCEQSITVIDTELPVIVCADNQVQGKDLQNCGAFVDVVNPTATDNCDGSTYAGVRSDGLNVFDLYHIGTTTITWTVTDNAGLTASCEQLITITNEAPSDISLSGTHTVNETVPVGTYVGTLTTTDIDHVFNPENAGDYEYEIVQGYGDWDAFTIDTDNPRDLLTDANFSSMNKTVYRFKVRTTETYCSDDATINHGGLVFEKVFEIIINAENLPPVINDQEFDIDEMSAVGTSVGTLVATDPNQGAQTLTYSIVNGNTGNAFALDAATGELTVATPEALTCGTVFELQVQVMDSGVDNLTDDATVTITVNDLNNNTPVATGGTATVAEDVDSDGSHTVFTVAATDADCEAELAYSITGGNFNNAFAIDDMGAITVVGNLDYETRNFYTLTVEVTDGMNTTSVEVEVTVTDVNETAPVVEDLTATVAEDAILTTVVANVVATDIDESTVLTYAIVNGNTGNAFAINAAGEITVAATLDYETLNNYELDITVTDGTYVATATATITVTDVNEFTPVVEAATVAINENVAAGTEVQQVVATDADGTYTLSYAIVAGNDGNAFAIDAAGMITVAGTINYEAQSSYALQVSVSDGQGLTGTGTIVINVVDVNETAPSFPTEYTFAVAENAANATIVGEVAAEDVDVNDVLTYSITAGNTNSAFVVNYSTGEITVANGAALDYEAKATYTLTVTASDGVFTGSTAVYINLIDVNEAPAYVSDNYYFSVQENAGQGTEPTVVGNVTATDPEGDVVTYSIVSGNDGGAFAIDASTGEITAANPEALDYETHPRFTLTVQVIDGVNRETAPNTATVVVDLTDEDDASMNIYTINNVFTPNGDGRNDTWVVKNVYLYKEFDLVITSKFGVVVYQAKGYQNDWDGTMNGIELPPDGYVFIFKHADGTVYKGTVSILR